MKNEKSQAEPVREDPAPSLQKLRLEKGRSCLSPTPSRIFCHFDLFSFEMCHKVTESCDSGINRSVCTLF